MTANSYQVVAVALLLAACSAGEKADSTKVEDSSAAKAVSVAAQASSASASTPVNVSAQNELSVALQKITLPKSLVLSRPTKNNENISPVAALPFFDEATIAAWHKFMENTSATQKRDQNRVITETFELVSQGRMFDAKASSAQSDDSLKRTLSLIVDAEMGKTAPEAVIQSLSDITVSIFDGLRIVRVVARQFGPSGVVLLNRYYTAMYDTRQMSAFRQELNEWPNSKITTGVSGKGLPIVWTSYPAEGSAPFNKVLVKAVAAAWEKLEANTAKFAPPTKQEFETTETFKLREQSYLSEAELRKQAMEQEWPLQLARAISVELGGKISWALEDIAYNADEQKFAGLVKFKGTSEEVPFTIPVRLEDAQEFKRDAGQLRIQPIFEVKQSGQLFLSEVKLTGKDGSTSLTTLELDLGLNVGKSQFAPILVALQKVQAEELAAEQAKNQLEREKYRAEMAARPDIEACLERVAKHFGNVVSGPSINMGQLNSELQAQERCRELPKPTDGAKRTSLSEYTNILPAGTAACSDQRDAIQYTMIGRKFANAPLPSSCDYIGKDVRVNVLRTAQMGAATVALVGNSGGTLWVSYDEIR